MYRFQVTADAPFEGKAGWSLRRTGRTLLRRERSFRVEPGKPATLEIPLRFPSTKDGVDIPVDLEVSLYGADGTPSGAQWGGTMWIFSREAFVEREEWLRGLRIGLFDPAGRTGEVFRELGIPFTPLGLDEEPGARGTRLAVIGSGIDFDVNRSLWEQLVAACAGGLSVLVLAPEGVMTLADREGRSPFQEAGLRFAHGEIISEIDKRLDARWWPPDGETVASSLSFRTSGGDPVVRFTRGRGGWPWLDVRFPDRGGTLIVCGFDIVAKIGEGPSPRYLLAGILQLMSLEGKKEEDRVQ